MGPDGEVCRRRSRSWSPALSSGPDTRVCARGPHRAADSRGRLATRAADRFGAGNVKCSVSEPRWCRKPARIPEARGVAKARRGHGGGLFVTQPEQSLVTDAAGVT
jgi:hypothetical protein